VRQRRAALRDFRPVYVRCGSFATGQVRGCGRGMSASRRKRTSSRTSRYVRLVPIATICSAANCTSSRSPRRQARSAFRADSERNRTSNLFLSNNIHPFGDIACLIVVVGYNWELNKIRLCHRLLFINQLRQVPFASYKPLPRFPFFL
jgi:hypothetical protein